MVAEIRARISLSDLIGPVVELRRRGRELIGLCPFHDERSPSFTINQEKGFFHCFGCGAHGDALGWVMRYQGVTFPRGCRAARRRHRVGLGAVGQAGGSAPCDAFC